MATITKGQVFGQTEQITNTKLHALVDSATISGILASEMSNNFLTSLASSSGLIPPANLATITSGGVTGKILYALASIPSGAGKIPPTNLSDYQTVATNSSVPSLLVGTIFKLWASTYGCIASFSNMIIGQRFTLVAGQASFPSIGDDGKFLLSADWKPAKASDNLTLIWDGTNFVEVGRVTV
jgi:hypothetical protein